MGRRIDYPISQADDAKSIKHFLKERGYSASVLTQLKQANHGICLNGHPVFVTSVLHQGDVLSLGLPDETSETVVAEPILLSILYEDADICIVDKPAGMAVHPTKKIQSGTLGNAFAYYTGQTGESVRFRPLYRLDSGTSGLVVVAKHKLACALLAGHIQKTYLCLCEGILPHRGTMDGPIGMEEESTLKRCVRPDGQSAVTHFQCLMHGDSWSLARVSLETGRTHQIRCHFAHDGHPLLGDFLYGTETSAWSRHALHCSTVALQHPITGENLAFHSDLPQDMCDFLKNNGKNFCF